mgnify:CR=1 FL=1
MSKKSDYLSLKEFYMNSIGTKDSAKEACELLDNMDCVKALQAARAIVEIMELKVRECFGEVSE